jgi:protein kinase-like protein
MVTGGSEGAQVGRYTVVRELGRGGMATVYLARQRDLGRLVALKELGILRAADGELAARFLGEARLAGGLSHPNVVTVHDYFAEDGAPFIAMEYVPCGSLRDRVAARLTPAQVGGALAGMLAGLAHAESRGIVHRDMKPENVLVTTEGAVKIADFGIAKAGHRVMTIDTRLTATGMTLGTPAYMAPEQALGQEVTARADLYAVGVMAFELLAGRAPFADTEAPMAVLLRQVNDDVPPVTTVRPDVDARLSGWIARLLEKDPADRTPSAAAARDELEEILLDLLGPRWQRDAPLPVLDVGATGARTPLTQGLPAAPASALDIAPEHVTGPARTLTAARTLAPRAPITAPAVVAAPAQRSRAPSRWTAGILFVVAVVALFAALARRSAPPAPVPGTQPAGAVAPAAPQGDQSDGSGSSDGVPDNAGDDAPGGSDDTSGGDSGGENADDGGDEGSGGGGENADDGGGGP